MSYTRFGIYYLPPDGPLAAFGAGWLGWDVVRGAAAKQPDLPDIEDVTATPRKYGFHGTLKPPFRLAPGMSQQALEEAIAALVAVCAPAHCDGLTLTPLGRFLALTATGDASGIGRVAADCVRDLDRFRAAPTDAELARRRKSGLTARQEAMLTAWGYPYVIEEFRFHMTLTGRLPRDRIGHWQDTLADHLPPLPAPFALDAVALVGERADGCFELIRRYPLAG
ncbi:DUF1045 domain-containing protein [Thalassococcus sp. BH17M4-6]|uniref:DUF1045 domain-containing protein n=1 Tax=Thalassococcus sp. BH17M4-6 TaxID=3413148 RepID=UPI003BC09D06